MSKLSVLTALLGLRRLAVVLVASIIFTHSMTASSQSAAHKATLSDYWAGKADWSLVDSRPDDSASGASHIEILNDKWYLFERYIAITSCTRFNAAQHHALGTRVRVSTDKGASWSEPTIILPPQNGTFWECAATDGDAHFDAANNKWRFLFQCLDNTTSGWRGCYAERADSDPMGPFVVVPSPVIEPGEIWDDICDISQDDCSSLAGGVGTVTDEGTFNIFKFDGTYYWVSFHGYYAPNGNGFRGIAKTTNFIDWVAGSPALGVPSDAIADRNDLLQWRELWDAPGPIGVGAGSILFEGGYYYLFMEGADHNLGCTNEQHWDFGLFRSQSLTSTSWQQFPQGNPIIYSSRVADYPIYDPPAPLQYVIPPCAVLYGQIFKDAQDGLTYLKYSRFVNGGVQRYIYKLQLSNNLLRNSDLWMADTSHWVTFPIGPTNKVVFRDPENSSDGNQYLAFNCGTNPAPCQPGQSFYQDVSVVGKAGYWLTYGGKLATLPGAGVAAGNLILAAFQLSPSGIVQSSSIPVSATGNYFPVASMPTPILPDATSVRYQIYMTSSDATFRADEMYVNVTPSVSECSMGMSWGQTDQVIGHSIGRPEFDGWSATPALDSPGFLQFGPYVNSLQPGSHVAKWKMMLGQAPFGLEVKGSVVRLEVVDTSAGFEVLGSREIGRADWSEISRYECFAIPFSLRPNQVGHSLEFRVWWRDSSYVRLQRLGVD